MPFRSPLSAKRRPAPILAGLVLLWACADGPAAPTGPPQDAPAANPAPAPRPAPAARVVDTAGIVTEPLLGGVTPSPSAGAVAGGVAAVAPIAGGATAWRRVLVGFTGRADAGLVAGLGGVVRHAYHLVPAVAATVPPTAIALLAANPAVAYVEADLPVTALSTEETRFWGGQRIGADRQHRDGNRGEGIRIGIIDSGIDYTHPDLADNYAGGYDFADGDPDPMDDDGHGTFVAGVVAARANGAGALGVAPGARLYALKVLDAKAEGFVSDVIAAVEWCRDHGVQVTSNALGTAQYPGRTLESAYDRSASAGLTHVGAAGNEGGTRVSYPARYPAVIAVGTTDRNDRRVWFSPTAEEVELVAPGVGIYATSRGGGYAWVDGTSISCAQGAGAAALLLAQGATNPRGELQLTARDLGPAGRDPEHGYGLIQVGAPAGPPPPAPPAGQLLVLWDGEGGGVAQSRFHFGDANSSQAFDGRWCFEGRPTPWHEPGIGLNGMPTWRADLSGHSEISFYAKADTAGRTFQFSVYGWPDRSRRVDIDRHIDGGRLDTEYRLVRIPVSALRTDRYPLDRVEILYFGTAQPEAGHRIYIDQIAAR